MTQGIPLDESAIIWSEPVSSLRSRPLVVLLHGRGSHERDLTSLVPVFASGPLADTEPLFASLRAPFIEGGGFAWFASGLPGLPDPESSIGATLGVLEWLERVAPAGPVVVVGFSQGGAMALQLLRHAPERFAALACLAGFVIEGGADAATDAALAASRHRPPVFWGKDPSDPVIPQSAVERTERWVDTHADVMMRDYPGIAHSISREEIDDVAAFTASAIAAAEITRTE